MRSAALAEQVGESGTSSRGDGQRPVQSTDGEPQRRRPALVLRLAEVADLVRLSPSSIVRLEKSCRFPLRLPHYGRPHYRSSDVLRWIDGGWSMGRAFGRGHRSPR